MLDPTRVRAPGCFDPARDAADSMVFGHGLHWCVAKYIAQAQIAQTLKPLLCKENVRRAKRPEGRMKLIALFPESLTLEFDR
jgi:cytochrome P450